MSGVKALMALSPLDGRYRSKVDALRPLLSEYGYMRQRVRVELAWWMGLSELGLSEMPRFGAKAQSALMRWAD